MACNDSNGALLKVPYLLILLYGIERLSLVKKVTSFVLVKE